MVADGSPWVLTGDAFYKVVVELKKVKAAEERVAETKKDARVVYAATLKEWKEGEVV